MKRLWLVLVVGCQPPPPANPCPPQTVYVAAPPTTTTTPVEQPPPVGRDPYDLPISRPPPTGTQAAIAERLNTEGELLLAARSYAQATMKFREAAARVPEPKYFTNLCESLFDVGTFTEALTACNASLRLSPAADLEQLTKRLIARILAAAKAQGISIEP